MLSSSGKEPVVAKVPKGAKIAKKKEPGSSGPKASRAKKATAKVQSNGKTTGTPTISLTLACLSKAQPADVGPKETVALTLGAAGQEAATTIPGVAGKTPEAAKEVKKGEKKKPSKKRKLAAGDAGLEETTGKKLKVQGDPKALAKEKKKKKKKAKSSDDTKTPKKKDGKEKTADKKKKKSKKLESLSQDDLQKKKKKKKKSGDLEGTT